MYIHNYVVVTRNVIEVLDRFKRNTRPIYFIYIYFCKIQDNTFC